MRQPTLVDVAQGILATWKDLDPAVIHNVKCCISNTLDGSDDDTVWQDQQSASDAKEDDDGDVYYNGALNDVNLATIQSLLDSDSDDENTFEGFR